MTLNRCFYFTFNPDDDRWRMPIRARAAVRSGVRAAPEDGGRHGHDVEAARRLLSAAAIHR
jgi:hypothetical protein